MPRTTTFGWTQNRTVGCTVCCPTAVAIASSTAKSESGVLSLLKIVVSLEWSISLTVSWLNNKANLFIKMILLSNSVLANLKVLYNRMKWDGKKRVINMEYKDKQLDEVKVFKDPVHRYVHVRDLVIWDLIATKEFQRLRRIKQLGTTYVTFHGA